MPRSAFSCAYGGLLRALVEARRSAGIRQVDLAKRLKKPQSYVSKMENGERRLDVIKFIAVARSVGVDPIPLLAEA